MTLGLPVSVSRQGVAETPDRLEDALMGRGIPVFARFDVVRDATAADLNPLPQQLPIFGSPTRGSQLLAAQSTAGIDLSFKVPAWPNTQDQVNEGCHDPAYIITRHELEADFAHNPAPLVPLIAQAAG